MTLCVLELVLERTPTLQYSQLLCSLSDLTVMFAQLHGGVLQSEYYWYSLKLLSMMARALPEISQKIV